MSEQTLRAGQTQAAASEPPIPAGEPGQGSTSGLAQAFRQWAIASGLERKAAFALTVLALLSGFATYIVLTDSGPAPTSPETVLTFLYLDLFFLLCLGLLIIRHLVRIYLNTRQGQAGSRLHLRMIMMFGAVAVTPTILVSAFSILFFDFGVRAWFSERVGVAVKSSLAVAEAYLDEHKKNIRGDVLAMANDIDRDAPALVNSRQRFNSVVSTQAAVRNLTEALVFDGAGRVLARTSLSFSFEFNPLPDHLIQRAREGEVVVTQDPSDDRIMAVVKLSSLIDGFLYVSRYVDQAAIAHLAETRQAVEQYTELEVNWFDIRFTFALIFVVVALLLLLAAVWVGLTLANTLVRPVSSLITGAERVRNGDLSARVGVTGEGDELDRLSQSFNRMTEWLESQQRDLIDANHQLDIRRIFTEAVLEGVSAGVIGLDNQGHINLPNRSASRLLDVLLPEAINQPLDTVVPEFAGLLGEARLRPERLHQAEIELVRGNRRITLLTRITSEMEGDAVAGYVVTFDDITELLSAQRKAAWADVARRIAHEIKNPLTPIQLSAERLKRKYLKQIVDDPETFESCTETIVRQVGDIGRMVDEFSSFARMPAPVMEHCDLAEILSDQIALQKSARSDVEIMSRIETDATDILGDSRLVRQAVTNLLQNAIDAIEGARDAGEPDKAGMIEVSLLQQNARRIVEVRDNGIGLPDEDRHLLTEPYVTRRAKGTGLGLAIVRKIMEDHDGQVELDDPEGPGAIVRLVFPEPVSE